MSPGMSGMFLDPAGKTPWAPTWIPGLGSQPPLSPGGAPTRGSPATASKGIQLLFASF